MARQDTIDETNEDSKSLRRQALERQVSERESGGSQREQLEKASSIERELMAARAMPSVDTYDISSTQRDLIASVFDLKTDSRLEMQRMSQRIGRLEDLLTELVKRLSHDSSDLSTPADENIPTITTTFVGSPTTSPPTQSTNIIVTTTASTSATGLTSGIPTTQPSSSSGKLKRLPLLIKIFKRKYLHFCIFILPFGRTGATVTAKTTIKKPSCTRSTNTFCYHCGTSPIAGRS